MKAAPRVAIALLVFARVAVADDPVIAKDAFYSHLISKTCSSAMTRCIGIAEETCVTKMSELQRNCHIHSSSYTEQQRGKIAPEFSEFIACYREHLQEELEISLEKFRFCRNESKAL